MQSSERSLTAFLNLVASDATPVPAAGSVTALTGAGSAALVALVCRLSTRGHRQEALATCEAAEDLQRRLLDMVDADAAAYLAFVDARGTPDEVAARQRAAESPLDIARACADVARLAELSITLARKSIRSDVQVAHLLAGAAREAALATATANLALLPDPQARAALAAAIAAIRTA